MSQVEKCIQVVIDIYRKETEYSHAIVNQTVGVLCKNYLKLSSGNMSDDTRNEIQGSCCNGTFHAGTYICKEFMKIAKYDFNSICPEFTTHLSSNLHHYDTITYVLLSLLIPMGLIGNILILYAIMKLKCLPIQTGNFLASLAFADLGYMLQYCFWLFTKGRIHFSTGMGLYFYPSADIFFSALVLLQITAISIERSVAVSKPLKYPSLVSAKRSKTVVYIIWSMAVVFFVFSMSRILVESSWYGYFMLSVAGLFLLVFPLVTIIISYTVVLVSAYKNLSQDRKRLRMLAIFLRRSYTPQSSNDVTMSPTSGSSLIDQNTKCRQKAIRCREIKLAINVAMIVLPFLGCWGFFAFVNIYETIVTRVFKNEINWLISILPFITTCLNPVLYLAFTRSLRDTVKSLIQRKVKSRLSRTEVSMLTLASNNNGIGNLTMNNNVIKFQGRSVSSHRVKKDVLITS